MNLKAFLLGTAPMKLLAPLQGDSSLHFGGRIPTARTTSCWFDHSRNSRSCDVDFRHADTRRARPVIGDVHKQNTGFAGRFNQRSEACGRRSFLYASERSTRLFSASNDDRRPRPLNILDEKLDGPPHHLHGPGHRKLFIRHLSRSGSAAGNVGRQPRPFLTDEHTTCQRTWYMPGLAPVRVAHTARWFRTRMTSWSHRRTI